jgi:hypothetical protein
VQSESRVTVGGHSPTSNHSCSLLKRELKFWYLQCHLLKGSWPKPTSAGRPQTPCIPAGGKCFSHAFLRSSAAGLSHWERQGIAGSLQGDKEAPHDNEYSQTMVCIAFQEVSIQHFIQPTWQNVRDRAAMVPFPAEECVDQRAKLILHKARAQKWWRGLESTCGGPYTQWFPASSSLQSHLGQVQLPPHNSQIGIFMSEDRSAAAAKILWFSCFGIQR